MNRVDLIVFDLDGTLVDASQDLADAANDMLERIRPGTTPLPLALVTSFVGEGAGRLVEKCLAAAGLPQSREEVLSTFLESYRGRLLRTTRLYPGMEAALEALSVPLAVLTNKPGDLSRELLNGLGCAKWFSRICGGGDLPGRKPDPQGLLWIAEKEGVSPQNVLMVGDSGIDIRTGRAAGALTAGVLYGFDPEGVRAERPDFVVKEPREIPLLVH